MFRWFFLCFLSLPLVSLAAIDSIERVDRVLSESPVPPGADASWEEFRLIGATRTGTVNGDRQTWFRFYLTAPQDARNQAYSLYFWRYNRTITVFMNGRRIDGDEIREGFETTAWNRGRLVEIHPSEWLPGENVIHVRFNPTVFGGTFAHIKFGKTLDLKPAAEERFFWKVRINEYLMGFCLLAALSSLVLWLFRRSDSVYLLFFGLSVSWSVVTAHMMTYFLPIPYGYWLPLVHAAIDSWILFLFAFLNRVLGYRMWRLERFMIAGWVLAMASHAFMPRAYFWFSAYIFHVILIMPIIIVFARAIYDSVVKRQTLAVAVAVALLGQLSFSGHDFWLFFMAQEEEWEQAQHLSQFGVPFLIGVLLLMLVLRFSRALEQAEELNEQLEDRVLKTRQALEKSFEANRQLELDRAAAQERQKIYRDLHDDVGSKLLAITHQEVESPISRLAGSALESIREAIYRSNYRDEPLLDFLSNVREEVTMRTDAQGISVRWFEDPDLPDSVLETSQCYHLSRVVRELVTNSLAHSRCTEIRLSFEIFEDNPELLLFEFSDNGQGAPAITNAASNGKGSGLSNIAFRTEQIGGSFTWSSENGLAFEMTFAPNYVSEASSASSEADASGDREKFSTNSL